MNTESVDIFIGMVVRKQSGKPFKNGEKLSTVAGYTTNPHTNLPALVFVEHGAIVDLHQCVPA